MRRSATVTICVPLWLMASLRSFLFLNLPVPSRKRLVNVLFPIISGVSLIFSGAFNALSSRHRGNQFNFVPVLDEYILPLAPIDDLAVHFGNDKRGVLDILPNEIGKSFHVVKILDFS